MGAEARIHFPGHCWGHLLSSGQACAETSPLPSFPLAFGIRAWASLQGGAAFLLEQRVVTGQGVG